ncbi:MAG TPA: DUF5667 domain-containing protein [Ktedonobacterales bacterium]|nr:DUF5667 domain-containing protein [Ktedonobacterales bacterium]
MSELEDLRRARLFDTLLDEIEQWRVSPNAQTHRAAEHDEGVAADLALIEALGETQPAREEAQFARARIGRRLDELMRVEPMGAEAARPHPHDARAWARARLRALTAPPAAVRASARATNSSHAVEDEGDAVVEVGRVWLRRAAPLVAALLLVFFASLAGASAASAQALPESPLYSIKRGEESVLLALSWGDVSKGQTLTMVASHRLVEAAAEADQGHANEAHALLGEFDSAFSQLIDLGAHARASHEDTSTFVRALQTTLETEQAIAAHASTHGQTAFAQAASMSVKAAAAHMRSVGFTPPSTPGGANGNSHANGHGAGNGNGSGNPQQTPGAQASHTPRPTPSGGNPNGQKPTPTTGTPTTTSSAPASPAANSTRTGG